MHRTDSYTSTTSSWAGSLTNRQQRTRYVGIDVGLDRVSVASMGWTPRRRSDASGGPTLRWFTQSSFPIPIDPSDGPCPDWVDVVADTLRDQLPRCVEDSHVVATLSLPSTWVHYQTTGVGDIAATQAQCDAMFGASVFRSPAHLVHWPVVQGGDTHQVAATPTDAAIAIAKAVADVGYEVESILPPGAALLHASTITAIKISAILSLDPIGGLISTVNEEARKTSGAVLCGLCRPLPVCELETGSSLHVGQLESWLVDVADQYSTTCRYARRVGDPSDASLPVLICGQLAAVEGVDRLLASLIERPVATWRYAGRIRPGMGNGTPDRRNAEGNFTRQQWDSDTTEALSVSLAFCSVGLASDKSGAK